MSARASWAGAACCGVLGALGAGCYEHARLSLHNAPGDVDLSTPVEREDGDPQRFEPARSPGSRTLTVFAMPSFMFGAGRQALPAYKAAFEPGLELRFERHAGRDGALLAARSFAVTAGVGFLQSVETRPVIAGPLFAELDYRFLLGGSVPAAIGAGPVAYPADFDAGAQITARFPLLAVRARYLATSGFELWGGIQIPIPFFFERSR